MKRLNAARLTLLALLIVAPASSALAGNFSAVLNGRSIHVGATDEWNEDNVGLGLEYEFASESRWKRQVMVNGFRDSNDDMSYMAGAGLHRTLFATDRLNGFYVDAGVNAFLMTRTDVNDNRPFPGAVPSLSVGNRHMGFNLTYLPVKAVERLLDVQMMDDTVSGLFFLQFKVDISRLLPND
ncbi:MAG: hypothetical protein KJO95_08075 [Gammaproteobacteria bacterium]|nr:hypothetical protein [Gammaproteobacteria bacterium]NNC56670.1 hypothetical protein [Woeseiaceae bacterium]